MTTLRPVHLPGEDVAYTHEVRIFETIIDMMTRKHVESIETPEFKITLHPSAFLVAVEVQPPKVDNAPDLEHYNSKVERQRQQEEFESVLFLGESR